MIKTILKWDRFITPKIIKYFYYFALVIIFLSFLVGLYRILFGNLQQSFGISLPGLLIFYFIISAFVILGTRVFYELIYVVFRINENLESIRKNGRL